jgi:predicted acetyltransferase
LDTNIKKIEYEDIAESLKLSEFAFQYELSAEERAERIAHFKPEYNWGYFVDEQLAAKMTIFPLHTRLNGTSYSMGGIAGVATWPEYRRHGMVKKLLIHALEKMKEHGQTISFLHPFEFSFYRKFGWETYTDYQKYEIPVFHILNQFVSTGRMKRTTDWRVLDEIYQAYASKYNGMLIRDEDWWNTRILVKKGDVAVFYDGSGIAKGYIHYQVKNKEFNLYELVFHDESARQGLWKFIADHDSMIEKILVSAPSDDRLAFLLANPRIKQETIPYFMARIVDIVRFLELYPGAVGLEKFKLELNIVDEYAPWNNGAFIVKWNSSGKAKVKRAEAGELKKAKEAEHLVSCNIGTLTTLFMGYQRPKFLQSIGRLQTTDVVVELLEQLIPQKTTYLMDFF